MSRQRKRDKPAVVSLFFSHTHAKSVHSTAKGFRSRSSRLTTKPRDCGGTRCRVFCAEIPVDHRIQYHHQISLGGF
ncbi:hypothetical protein HYE67_005217 [Fusarium culmorum]|uniref:Uncharacterized protein n=1 Tax=Fusarium culmorum TaxID=5516 RepID=A0A2T4GYF2_FUSCU|nr:hypothetical protein FCULG_00012462 [Fusarium culmorum]QPC62986.1 hypothetical protein HYE67_005217 [Fusarium culmorum]